MDKRTIRAALQVQFQSNLSTLDLILGKFFDQGAPSDLQLLGGAGLVPVTDLEFFPQQGLFKLFH